MTPISVIIASYNAAPTLDVQLGALLDQAWPCGGEIIVADNSSTDETPAVVAVHADRAPTSVPVRRIEVNDAAGAAHTRNVAVEHAAHEAIAFCDADDIVGPTWVTAMSEALETERFVGGPLNYEQVNEPWLVGARGRLLDENEPARFEGTFPIVSSCNMGIDRTLFRSVGGFDTTFERVEDAELSHRLWQDGVEAVHRADVMVHYRMRTTPREIFAQSRSWGRQLPLLRSHVGTTPAQRPSASVKRWLWLVASLPQTVNRAGRAHWLHVAGTRIGSVEGRRRVAST